MNNNEPLTSKHILVTGGTGLIGKLLTDKLLNHGYKVSHLSRRPGNDLRVKTFIWDVGKNEIDDRCIDGVDMIIHLAGAGIADKRWSDKRKKELIESRTHSIALIYKVIKDQPNRVSTVISASATGYYSDRGDELLTEESQPADDFLGQCCIEWEKAVDNGKSLALRIVKFRTGVVLHKKGGALPQMALPVKLGLGSPFGNGKQWIPWIHWEDVVDLYLHAVENTSLSGVYNMVAPRPVTNKQLTQAIAKQLHKPMWLPNVPAFVFKFLLGEMSVVVLGSTKVSPQKIENEGFIFKYPDLTGAFNEIYRS
jgi:uncharacterized protein (TIGR01777 family)